MEGNKENRSDEELDVVKGTRTAIQDTLTAAEALHLDTNLIRNGRALVSLDDCLNGLQGHLVGQQLGVPLTTEHAAKEVFRQTLQVQLEEGHLPAEICQAMQEIQREIIDTPLPSAEITLDAMNRYRAKTKEITDAARTKPHLNKAIAYYIQNLAAIGKKQSEIAEQAKN